MTLDRSDDLWELCLYVVGSSPRSLAARQNIEALCATHLSGRCRLEVVDLLDDPERARAGQVLAVPTLVRRRPEPTRRVVGDLSDHLHTLSALDLAAEDAAERRERTP